MKRPFALLMAATLLAGCTAPMPTMDPFLGRSTVPPPMPGAALTAPPGTTPYYSGAPTQPAIASPGPGSLYVPPDGRSLPQSIADRFAAARAPVGYQQNSAAPATVRMEQQSPARFSAQPKRLQSASPDETRPNSTPATLRPRTTSMEPSRSTVIRIVEPPARPAVQPRASQPIPTVAATELREPRRFDAPDEMTDITELAEVDRSTSSTSSGGSASSWSAPGVRRASYTEPTSGDTSAAASRATASPRNRDAAERSHYAFDPAYAWLTGKLEFSQVDQRWKLRYGPLDTVTDDFGGAVILIVDEAAMQSHQPGDWVTVHGSVAGRDASGKGFAPLYRAERIEAVQ